MQKRAVADRDRPEQVFSIQSIERAADVLRCFSLDESELGVTELSRRLGLHKSTVCRLLQSLEAADFVRQDLETGKYHLGLFSVRLAGQVLSRFQIREVALPYLMRLSQAVDETINLAVFNRTEVVNIFEIPSRRAITHVGWLGRANPLHCTSGGKVALGFLPPAERDTLLVKPLARYTPYTITSPAELLQQISAARAQGYAVSRDEFEEELTGIAAPVLDFSGHLVAVVGISGPTYRMPETRISDLATLLKQTAHEISIQMGFVSGSQETPDRLPVPDLLASALVQRPL